MLSFKHCTKRKEGLLTDDSKAFDCLSIELITAKLNAYGFGFNLIKLINKEIKKSKVNHSYSSRQEVLFRVLQGSILAPILFNIFLGDLFLIIKDTDFASHVDDNQFTTQIITLMTPLHITAVIRKALQMVFR